MNASDPVARHLDADELRRSFLDTMTKYGSRAVPSASLIPENDSTTLFTGSGMQPMIPYLLGEKHPLGNDIANVQKCIRTVDIDVVGDDSHLTLFEMAGRWLLGADAATYKRSQIEAIWNWQINELGLDPNRFYVTVYKGNDDLGMSADGQAIEVWDDLFRKAGIEPKIETDPWVHGASRGGRIFLYGDSENWWSRSGGPDRMPVGELGGPDSEMFFDFNPSGDPRDHPASQTSRFIEIGNNVFMSQRRTALGFEQLVLPNIDYGGGLERLAAALNDNPDVYCTSFFRRPMAILEMITGRQYNNNLREFRIILDHTRAGTFLIGDQALPANTDVGYVTRRLLRRAMRVGRHIGAPSGFLAEIARSYIEDSQEYPEFRDKKDEILGHISTEERKFDKALLAGEREIKQFVKQNTQFTGSDAFYFYETFGFPIELTQEILGELGLSLSSPELFESAVKKHSEQSRTAAAGKFKGGLAEHSDKTTAYHTATHLMLAGLQRVLGDHVHQRGSNITAERARFDFSHPAKVTEEQRHDVELYVNRAINLDIPVTSFETSKDQAKKNGVEGSFWEKYPEMVRIFEMVDLEGAVWSRELCGGPHADRTGKLKEFGVFKIQKEEGISAGVRRIKFTLS